MKLKLTEDGKAALINDKGLPIYVRDDNTEVPFDAPATIATISRLNGEAKAHREAKEAAETKLKTFDGIEDAEAARTAIELTKNIEAGKLLSAGKVEEIKVAARKAAEDQVLAANKKFTEELTATQKERDQFRDDLYEEKVGGAFSRSKFISEKVAVPADLIQAMFRKNVSVEGGKIIVRDSNGNIITGSNFTDPAPFEEGIEKLITDYPRKDQILKGANNSGSGARQSNNGAGGASGKTMKKSAYDALPLMQQAILMSGKDAPTLIDD
jgi:hypothetical protein